MDQKKIAKQSMELNKTTFVHMFNTMTPPQSNPEKIFFRFVDKNPLFPDNSKEAIHEYVLASRKRRSDFKSHFDEGCKNVTGNLMSNSFHFRNK